MVYRVPRIMLSVSENFAVGSTSECSAGCSGTVINPMPACCARGRLGMDDLVMDVGDGARVVGSDLFCEDDDCEAGVGRDDGV